MSDTTTATAVRPADTTSTWSDEESDTTEEAHFLGADGERILTFLYRPTSRPLVGAVVMCGSIYEDFVVNYRRELLVARELAKRGFATVRFHYRGFGNSDAAPGGAVTFESMAADAQVATAWLAARTGVDSVINVGARVGALVAAAAAAEVDGTPAVLWAPLASGADFFKGMSRASLLAGVRAEAKNREASASPVQRLRLEDVEMLGNQIRQTSYESLERRKLPTDLGSRRVLLVQVGTGEALSSGNESLVSGWREKGADVGVHLVRYRQLWSVPERWESVDERPETVSIVQGIADWIDTTAQAER